MGVVCGSGLFENRWVRFAYPPYAVLTAITALTVIML